MATTIFAKSKDWSLRIREWWTSSYRTCDVGEHEPVWVSARRSNFTNCAFYRLPDELLLLILGNLDNTTRGLVQRTCGLFMRIMYDPTLECQPPRWWRPGYSPVYFNDPPHPQLVLPDRHLLDRDRLCDDCLRFREDGRYDNAMKAIQDTLWCSHCNEFHKRPLFSSRQRAASPMTRVCVLTEGRVYICNHESIGSSWLTDPKPIPPKKALHQLCQHPDHHLPWYTLWKLSSKIQSGNELVRQGKPHIQSNPFLYQPDNPLYSSQATILLFKLHHQTPVTRAFLQERLIANAHILGKMLCPHITVDDGQLLLPFCPDRCACFDSMRWNNHRCYRLSSCCGCTAAELPGRAGYFLPPCLFSQHIYECTVCDACYSWYRYGSAVTLTIRVLKPSYYKPGLRGYYPRSSCWAYKLHPESWGILEDDEIRHVAWCDDIFCTSRWRWEKLSQLLFE